MSDSSDEEKEVGVSGNLEVGNVDPFNTSDVEALRQILRSSNLRRWVEYSPGNDTWEAISDWANAEKRGEKEALFVGRKNGEIQGYVYFYPSEITDGALEMTYAKRPGTEPGQMSDLLKQSSLKVREKFGNGGQMRIVCEIDPENRRSIEVAKKAGFEYAGEKVWEINWDKMG